MPVDPLVSVVIPCYNAERWVSEAVDSCLGQTYLPLEIVVIDDGSTDGSAEILRSYGDKICAVFGPNRGGSSARNQGLALSQGEYIQFLDADDYLLPEKIGRQVAFLEESGADAVYGDWRHLFHEPDGSSHWGDVQATGQQADVLESLLAGWWVANNALLVRRQAVVDAGGWDETLGAGQDRDFFTTIALSGADIRYQPGCLSVYRRYGKVTVSTSDLNRWQTNHKRVLEKAECQLELTDRLLPRYRRALATSYFRLARSWYDSDRAMYQHLLARALSLCPSFEPDESPFYNAAWRLLGFEAADRLASYKRRLSRRGGAG
ncbi:MAG: glycosyltransferase [Anaerolineae bacterium]|nr:glycosyltransferase [Anaerolineae bacterium]